MLIIFKTQAPKIQLIIFSLLLFLRNASLVGGEPVEISSIPEQKHHN